MNMIEKVGITNLIIWVAWINGVPESYPIKHPLIFFFGSLLMVTGGMIFLWGHIWGRK